MPRKASLSITKPTEFRMMFPEETLQLIQSTAQKAQEARLLPELSGDGRKAFVQQGGAVKEFPLPPPLREHLVHTLDDLIAYAFRPDNPKPVVWHGVTGVVLLPDDADRRDRIVFPLAFSERYLCLAKLAKEAKALNQQQFVRLLRRDLGIDAATVQQFRKLDWKNGDNGSSEVNPHNMKVSKSILAEVNGVKDIPEELTVPTPVYSQCGERTEYNVQCYIEIDAVNQVFGFGPLPDELTKIIDLAQADIRGRLDKALAANGDREAIPVYYGAP